jgi:endonuclease YncB( thermonuclease family)
LQGFGDPYTLLAELILLKQDSSAMVKFAKHLKYLFTLGAILAGSCAYTEPHNSTFLNPTVCKVIDGDTFKICDGTSIRLAGIDTPEHGEPFYWEARRVLAGLIQTHDLKLTDCHTDTTGKRQACSVQADGKDAEAELVRQGMAWDWPRFSKGKYADSEMLARTTSRAVDGRHTNDLILDYKTKVILYLLSV